MKRLTRYAVIDDFGSDWEDGPIAFESTNADEVFDWAEAENYQTASIIEISEDGTRRKLN